MFHHTHPYKPFIPTNATKLIVGTLPPPRFTTGELKENDVDWCYGSRDGQLWPILDAIFNLNLLYETTSQAIKQRKQFLTERGIGICDIVASAKRKKIDASDIGMQQIELRNLIAILQENTSVETLLFTGGNSKNGPEYFFRRLLKAHHVQLTVEDDEVPRIHSFSLPLASQDLKKESRIIKTVSLTAPSGAANRAVGSLQKYKDMKAANPKSNTIDFRINQYAPFF